MGYVISFLGTFLLTDEDFEMVTDPWTVSMLVSQRRSGAKIATRIVRPIATKVSKISKGLRNLRIRGNPKDGE